MKNIKQRFFIACLFCLSHVVMAEGLVVSNSQDSGEGSFRAAMSVANTNSLITEIYFNVSEPIHLLSSIKYLGQQTLILLGQGVEINGSQLEAGSDLFVSKTGASLSFNQIRFNQSPARMIAIRIPIETTGTVAILLKEVNIQRAGKEGLYIADRVVLENEVSIGSPASIHLHIENSVFNENGLQGVGADGVRVIEFGEGHIIAEISHSTMNGNGDDGLDLAENDGGDINFYGHHLEVNSNGFFNPENPEDGIDIDETGLGNLYLNLSDIQVNNNADEGMDIDESDDGHILITFINIVGNQNGDESLRLDESGSGYIDATFFNMTSLKNGDDGVQIRETNAGRLHLNFTEFNASGNEKNGVRIEQFTDNDEIDSEENAGWILNGNGIILEDNLLAPFLLKGVSVKVNKQ